jgi:hypothetical protein
LFGSKQRKCCIFFGFFFLQAYGSKLNEKH